MPDRCTCGRPNGKHTVDRYAVCESGVDDHICDLMTDARVKVLQEAARHNDGHWSKGRWMVNGDALRKEAAKIRRKAKGRR